MISRNRLLIPLWVTCLIFGCKKETHSNASPNTEITNNPMILADTKVSGDTMKFHGISLGDSEVSIPQSILSIEKDKSGFRSVGDGHIEFKDGYVRSIIVTGDLLRPLKLDSEDVIQIRFGKADEVKHDEILTRYFFYSRHLIVNWIDIQSPPVATISLVR